MKNFQVRLSDDLYKRLKNVADRREETIATNLRRAIEEYVGPRDGKDVE